MINIASMFLALASPALAQSNSDARWEGYLWKDKEGKTRIGEAVMGQSSAPNDIKIVEGALADRLSPILSPLQSATYDWGASWLGIQEGDTNVPLKQINPPRFIVRLDGKVHVIRKTSPADTEKDRAGPASNASVIGMTQGRLVWIEVLNDEWLRAWREIAHEDMAPLGLDDDKKQDDGGRSAAGLAQKLLNLLLSMRERSKVSREIMDLLKNVEPTAKCVDLFKREMESAVHHLLLKAQSRHRFKLAGLEKLGKPLAEPREVLQWFLNAPDKAAFISKVRDHWDGDWDYLQLMYYESCPYGLELKILRVGEAMEAWSTKDFTKHQEFTRKTLKENPSPPE